MKRSHQRPIAFNHVTLTARKKKDKILQRIEKILTVNSSYFYGKETKQIERKLLQFFGSGYVTTVASGHDALSIALAGLGVKTGDEVFFPVNAYPTVFPIALSGATLVPVDVDENGQLSVTEVKRKITKKTKAIVIVHLYGLVGALEEVIQLARAKNIAVIEDCAQAFGTRYKGDPVGTFGDIACLSFYPTKNLGTLGDGGALYTKHASLFSFFLQAKAYGEKERYNSLFLAGHSRLPEIQASILNVFFSSLASDFQKRKKIARYYTQRFYELDLRNQVRILQSHQQSDPVPHLFVIATKERNRLQAFLQKNRIPTLIHYPSPAHLIPSLASLDHKKGTFPMAEQLADAVLSLPFHQYLTKQDIIYITDTIKRFFNESAGQ